jgi:DNA-binding transcriptional LysR family regulator
MQDLNDLFYYVRVVEHGGFAPAERASGVPRSRLSRRIAALEERLGVRLIQRSTRHFAVTDIGRTYYQHCKAMLVEAEAAQDAIDSIHAEPRGIIRVSCPITLLHVHLGDFVADFMARYPRVTIHLEATNRRVDVLAEGVDVALRARPAPLEDSDLALRVLSDRGTGLVASPALLRTHGIPASPDELTALPSLSLSSPQRDAEWVLYGPDEAVARIRHEPRYVTDDMIALRKAAVAGLGMVLLPALMVRDQLRDGSLVPVLQDWAPRRDIIHAVFPTRRGMLPAVRLFIDELVAFYRSFEEE